DKGFALDSSDAMGVDPATVFKTIMAEIGRKYVVATVPVDTNLHLKKLARAGPGKRTEVMVGYPLFVDTELARPPCPAEDVHMGQRRISSDNGPPGPEGAAGGSSSQNRSIAQRSR